MHVLANLIGFAYLQDFFLISAPRGTRNCNCFMHMLAILIHVTAQVYVRDSLWHPWIMGSGLFSKDAVQNLR